MHITEATEACDVIKKTFQHWCFPVNIAKFLRAAFLVEHLWWLLLTSTTHNEFSKNAM